MPWPLTLCWEIQTHTQTNILSSGSFCDVIGWFLCNMWLIVNTLNNSRLWYSVFQSPFLGSTLKYWWISGLNNSGKFGKNSQSGNMVESLNCLVLCIDWNKIERLLHEVDWSGGQGVCCCCCCCRHRCVIILFCWMMLLVTEVRIIEKKVLRMVLEGGWWLVPCPGCFTPGK